MFRRFQITTVLLAWLLATGSQWDLAQTFAWGRMIAGHARTMSLLQAVRLTFTPGNECAVCNTVAAAKQQQGSPDTPGAKVPAKIFLVFQPVPVIVIATPGFAPWPSNSPVELGAPRASPSVPPPRAA